MTPEKIEMIQLIAGDARRIPLPDESVQGVVTSPPYWGLRKYAGEQELIWGGKAKCEHLFSLNTEPRRPRGEKDTTGAKQLSNVGANYDACGGAICARCGAWKGGYGLEPMIEMYIAHSLEILREIRRVLRKDGVVFWNIGDSYSGAQSRGASPPSGKQKTNHGTDWFCGNHRGESAQGLKPKDLCLIPERIALATQADGWWVRSRILWAKANPMPESVRDRPTDAAEHIWMFTKSERYFWDAEAVRESVDSSDTHSRGYGNGGPKALDRGVDGGAWNDWADKTRGIVTSRNMRSVWAFATQPYRGAHFATFPEEIPRRAILAATSAKGACAQCGKPWDRVTRSSVHFEGGSGRAMEREADRTPSGWHQSGSGRWPPDEVARFTAHDGTTSTAYEEGSNANRLAKLRQAARERGFEYGQIGGKWRSDDQAAGGEYDIRMGPVVDSQTIGWKPGCRCRGQRGRTVPCLVLDPFGGSGTTGKVALELGRRAALVDIAYHDAPPEIVPRAAEPENGNTSATLKPNSYRALAEERLSEVQLPLLLE